MDIHNKKIIESHQDVYYCGRKIDLAIKVIPSPMNIFNTDDQLNYTLYVNAQINVENEIFSGNISEPHIIVNSDNEIDTLQKIKNILINHAVEKMINNIHEHAKNKYLDEHKEKYEQLDIQEKELSHKANIAKWILNHAKINS